MRIAVKTLEAIDAAMIADQGAKFRGLLRHYMPLAEDAYNEQQEPFRSHLGASLIGRECERELWYSFHWYSKRAFSSQLLRLFNRGHLEEPRMVSSLAMIGCRVHQYDANGKQFRAHGHRGHFGGSLDAVIEGCPDIPNEPILGEFKTHNDSSFSKLKSEGVMASKWEHFIQMQEYMGYFKLNFALYGATNKNNDHLHMEIISFDPGWYAKIQEKAGRVIDAEVIPKKINESPGWFKCKFCDQHAVCHSAATPAKNCRTCSFSEVGNDGKWWCINEDRRLSLLFPASNPDNETFELTKERQLKACERYKVRT